MSNKSASMKFFETYGIQHDVEGCTPLFTEDAVIITTVAPGVMGIEEYKQVGYAFLAGIPDLSVMILDQIEEGDKVVNWVAWSGTQTGELNGMPPSGRSFRTEGMVLDRMVNGRIAERHEVSDMMGMMMQLGVIPTPGQ